MDEDTRRQAHILREQVPELRDPWCPGVIGPLCGSMPLSTVLNRVTLSSRTLHGWMMLRTSRLGMSQKSRGLWVTKGSSCRRAVAAIQASCEGIIRPAFCCWARSLPQIRHSSTSTGTIT